MLKQLLGDFRWAPPGWLERLGIRNFSTLLLVLVVIGFSWFGVSRYLHSLPERLQLVANAHVPGPAEWQDGVLRPRPLRVHLSWNKPSESADETQSFARLDLIGKQLLNGVRLSPALPGEWRFASENELVFQPLNDWPAATSFQVSIDADILNPDVRLGTDTLEFETAPLRAAIESFEFYRSPTNSGERYLLATLRFSHAIDRDSLSKSVRLAVRDSGKTLDDPATILDVSLRYDEADRIAYVRSAQVEVPAIEQFARLTLAEDVRPAIGAAASFADLQARAKVPDIGSYFRVANARTAVARDSDNNPEQTVVMNFTDRVASAALSERLELYLLPDAKIGASGTTYWSRPGEVTDAELARSESLGVSLDAIEGDSASLHSIRLDEPAGRFLFLRIRKGLTSDGDFVTSQDFETVVQLPEYPKEVSIAREGAVLPLSGDHKLSFVSRGLSDLQIEIGRLKPDAIHHFASQTRGDISEPNFSNYSFNQDNIAERSTEYLRVAPAHPREASYTHIDLSNRIDDTGFFFVRIQGWDPINRYPIGPVDERFVLISDLGLLVKTDTSGQQNVFVHSIATGKPVAGATVSLLGKNGDTVSEGTTNFDGRASLPSARALEREHEPVAYVVQSLQDRMFMPYGRGERLIRYSRFDVGGDYHQEKEDRAKMRAMLLTDRGIYRPGETVKIAALIKRHDWRTLPELPLEFSIRDPRGQNVHSGRVKLTSTGLIERSFMTEAAYPTGNYTATLSLPKGYSDYRVLGSVNFQIAEFQPDTLRIHTAIAEQDQTEWLGADKATLAVSVSNLFGTAASGNRVTARYRMTPMDIRPRTFTDFRFDLPRTESELGTIRDFMSLEARQTDESGGVSFDIDLGAYIEGSYQLSVEAEAFELEGGRSVKASNRIMVARRPFLVGYKSNGELGFINRGSERALEFIAINQSGAAISASGLALSIQKQRYVSSLVENPNGSYSYQSVRKTELLQRTALDIADSGYTLALDTSAPGEYLASIHDNAGQLLMQVPYSVAGGGNLSAKLDRDAELTVTTNGTRFSAGQEIEFDIKAPYTGTALVTIERESVLASRWIRIDSDSSIQRIRIPESLEGNAYLNVALIRDLDSPEIFVSPLSYAVVPFSLDAGKRQLDIELSVPDKVVPGQEFTISYKASASGKAIIYGVDEGILQVAAYKTPTPVSYFLPKMALQVETFQIADLILPTFDILQHLSAPGGGEGRALLGQNLNPFRRRDEKPAVFWSGVVDISSETGSLKTRLPEHFNGELRVMAVAVNETSVGAASTRTLSQAPIIISPHVLTAVAPGDEFDVSATVANNLDSGKSADFDIELRVSQAVTVVGENRQRKALGHGQQSSVVFRVRAGEQLGSQEFTFVAAADDVEVSRQTSFSIRPSVTHRNTVSAGVSEKQSLTLPVPLRLRPEYAERQLAASASPLVLTTGLLDYLKHFPHACAEQMVSKVFPKMGFLGADDSTIDRSALRQELNQTITKVRARQMNDGGFAFWLGGQTSAEFPSVYIMHFLTDAKENGVSVPRRVVDQGLEYLKAIASRETRTLADARLRAYAIYVLTRNELVTTNSLTDLHESLDRIGDKTWRSDITASYMAASYNMLKISGKGPAMLAAYDADSDKAQNSDFDTELGRNAMHLYLRARHFPDTLGSLSADWIAYIAKPVSENRFNTLSASYTTLALQAYTQAIAREGLPLITIDTQAAKEFARTSLSVEAESAEIKTAGTDPTFYVLSQSGFERSMPRQPLAKGLEVQREFLNADGEPTLTGKLGEELTVRLRLRSLGGTHSNIALIDLLPGGFEVIRESAANIRQRRGIDYVDVREDRIVVYATAVPSVTEILYKVKLTASGDFTIPQTSASSMYNHVLRSYTGTGKFSVLR